MKMKTRDFGVILAALCLISIGSGHADTFIVTNTNNDGAGSLRQAILDAVADTGMDTVVFQIPETDPGYEAVPGIWRIQPDTTFFINPPGNVFIDGSSQADFIGGDPNPLGPEIVLDASLTTEALGFEIYGSDVKIRGLVVSGFPYGEFAVYGDDITLAGCYVGCDATGSARKGKSSGIQMYDAENVVIGGISEADRNVVAGCKYNGIGIAQYCRNVQVIGNYIGINAAGTDTLGNGTGIRVYLSRMITIGPGNVISGNDGDGIIFQDDADSSAIIGNFIGTDPSGTGSLGNQYNGINIGSGASRNVIGGAGEENRNVISGNGSTGISLDGATTDSNTVINNYIGTDLTGSSALQNGWNGVNISTGARYNIIGTTNAGEGNVISANYNMGVNLWNTGAENNTIAGNMIGTDATGTLALGNRSEGIDISSDNNRVGPGNTIAYNGKEGVEISGSAITVTQNSIHSNSGKGILVGPVANNSITAPEITGLGSVRGTAPPNSLVEIFTGPDDEGQTYLASVTADVSGNFYWAGTPAGFWVTATATDAGGNTSEFSIPKHKGAFTVTTTADTGNGSLRWALEMTNTNAGPDTILFDIPDTDPGYDGTVWTIQPRTALPIITGDSLCINGGSQTISRGNTNADGPEIMIFGRNSGYYVNGLSIRFAGNTVSGLVISGFKGGAAIQLSGDDCRDNRIWGNYLGTNAAGTDSVSNYYGIELRGGTSANKIGRAGNGNVISGNLIHGIYIREAESTLIVGNLIGTDPAGTNAVPNLYDGINMNINALNNTVGGIATGEVNVISGNGSDGIHIGGIPCNGNVFIGNHVGVDITATTALPNNYTGFMIESGASNNRVGGNESGEANVISGNGTYGIDLDDVATDSNRVAGNYIGTNSVGDDLGNGQDGVYIHNYSSYNMIGPGNTIIYNRERGIYVTGSETHYNTITQNVISANSWDGIYVSDNSNGSITAPVITGKTPLVGTAPANSTVEIFSDSTDQGGIYHGSVTADASGNWTWTGAETGPYMTATATDADGNTSQFSSPLMVSVEEIVADLPETFFMHQNYPNPFNPETTIQFGVKNPGRVELKVFNVLGREVATLADQHYQPGSYKVVFDASNLPSGLYVYKIKMKDFSAVRKMVILE